MRPLPQIDLDKLPTAEDVASADAHVQRIDRVLPFLDAIDRHAAYELYEVLRRKPKRTAEQIEQHEPMIAAWETAAAPRKTQREIEDRTKYVHSLKLPLTADDEQLICTGTLAQIETTRCTTIVRKWWDSDKPLLVLAGPPGRGKTFAASHALARLRGAYVRAPKLAQLYLASFGEEVVQREGYERADGLLVCDDIGTERNADSMCMALVELLDARRCGQRSIWITNLSRDVFTTRYPDPRLHSRLAQSALWIEDIGEDLRKKGAGS